MEINVTNFDMEACLKTKEIGRMALRCYKLLEKV
jgi:hypothetical protein